MAVFRILLMLALWILPAALMAAETRVIAFAQDTMANDFRKAQVFAVRDAAAEYPDLSFIYSNAKGQTSLLIHQIEGFIRQSVDVLVVGTNDETAVVPVITKAHQSGIPVIILDRGIQGDAYTTFINSDNIKIGSIGAEYIAQRLNGQGRVLLFEGIQAADVTQLRSQGFIQVMAQHPGIEVIKRTGNYLRKDALLEMEKLLAEGVELDAIFSESDSMLSGARMALQHRGIDPGSLITVGCDYTNEAREAIRDGSQTGSVRFPLGGPETVEIARKVLDGVAVAKHLVIPVELVTADNVDRVPPIF